MHPDPNRKRRDTSALCAFDPGVKAGVSARDKPGGPETRREMCGYGVLCLHLEGLLLLAVEESRSRILFCFLSPWDRYRDLTVL